jgi:hypothetical protein
MRSISSRVLAPAASARSAAEWRRSWNHSAERVETKATYTKPDQVATSVRSATHSWLGRCTAPVGGLSAGPEAARVGEPSGWSTTRACFGQGLGTTPRSG